MQIMALGTVEAMVKERLSFVPVTGWESKIESYKLQMYYFLQRYLQIADADVENDAVYTGLKRMLVVELVVYNLIINKIITTIGGSSSTSTTGEGTKRLIKAVADVVEADFEYAKASDGNTFAIETEKLIPELIKNINAYSRTLGFGLPEFAPTIKLDKPPFMSFINHPHHHHNG